MCVCVFFVCRKCNNKDGLYSDKSVRLSLRLSNMFDENTTSK